MLQDVLSLRCSTTFWVAYMPSVVIPVDTGPLFMLQPAHQWV